MRTSARQFAAGARGERTVGRQLSRWATRYGWHVLHAVPVGQRGADIDHVVIGPFGVVTVNTKTTGAAVWVGEYGLTVGGQPVDYLRKSRHEADRAGRLLHRATGLEVPVQAAIVFVGPRKVTVRGGGPADVAVLPTPRALRHWLHRQSACAAARPGGGHLRGSPQTRELAEQIAAAQADSGVWLRRRRSPSPWVSIVGSCLTLTMVSPRWPSPPWMACWSASRSWPPCWATMPTTAGWRSAPLSITTSWPGGAGTGWLTCSGWTWTGCRRSTGWTRGSWLISWSCPGSPRLSCGSTSGIRCSPTRDGPSTCCWPGTSRRCRTGCAAWRSGWPLSRKRWPRRVPWRPAGCPECTWRPRSASSRARNT